MLFIEGDLLKCNRQFTCSVISPKLSERGNFAIGFNIVAIFCNWFNKDLKSQKAYWQDGVN